MKITNMEYSICLEGTKIKEYIAIDEKKFSYKDWDKKGK